MTIAKRIFEPGHSAAEGGSMAATIDASALWTGEPARNGHPKSADFLDVEHHPQITFRSLSVDQTAGHEFRVIGDLTMRSVTRAVTLDVQFLGTWQIPYWSRGVDRGPIPRAGFTARTVINRHDFGVSWNSVLDRGGLVIGNEVRSQ